MPLEVKSRLYTQAHFDEEREEWTMNSSRLTNMAPIRRPVSRPTHRRPISEYALKEMQKNDEDAIHMRGENIIQFSLEMPMRTTQEYKNPKLSATLRSVLNEALRTEGDIDIMEQSYPDSMRSRLNKIIKRNVQESTTTHNSRAATSLRSDSSGGRRGVSATPPVKKPSSAYPKARGLVTK